jgi:hypothetical protein
MDMRQKKPPRLAGDGAAEMLKQRNGYTNDSQNATAVRDGPWIKAEASQ